MRIENLYDSLIQESVSQIIYHAAPIASSIEIIKSNTLKSHAGAISFTRSLTGSYHISNRMMSVIFEMDGAKLNQRFKGTPYGTEEFSDDDWGIDAKPIMMGKRNGQLEDRILSKRIDNFLSYVTRIHIHIPKIYTAPMLSRTSSTRYTQDEFGDNYLDSLTQLLRLSQLIIKTRKDVLIHTSTIPHQKSGNTMSLQQLVGQASSILSNYGREFVKENKEVIITESPLPDTWDRSMFTGTRGTFKKMVEYAKARAAQVGKGSSRVAFEVPYEGRKTIIKVAHNQIKGLAQNQEEIDILTDGYLSSIGILIPIIDYDKTSRRPVWIHTEYAEQITMPKLESFFDGVKLSLILNSIEKERSNRKSTNDVLPDHIYNNYYYNKLRDLLLSAPELMVGDLRSPVNWGLYKGKPVIIDLGFTNKIQKLY